jgi:hypothetical protein
VSPKEGRHVSAFEVSSGIADAVVSMIDRFALGLIRKNLFSYSIVPHERFGIGIKSVIVMAYFSGCRIYFTRRAGMRSSFK